MAHLQHGDQYQVIWNGSEWVITWTDADALEADDVLMIGVDPQSETASILLPILSSQNKRINHINLRR